MLLPYMVRSVPQVCNVLDIRQCYRVIITHDRSPKFKTKSIRYCQTLPGITTMGSRDNRNKKKPKANRTGKRKAPKKPAESDSSSTEPTIVPRPKPRPHLIL